MPSLTVINTSPLIFLSKGGYLELLQVLSAEIVVLMAVRDEIYAYGEDDVTAKALRKTDWLVVRQTPEIPTIIQNWDLGKGDTSKRITKDGGQMTNDLQFFLDRRNRQILFNDLTYA